MNSAYSGCLLVIVAVGLTQAADLEDVGCLGRRSESYTVREAYTCTYTRRGFFFNRSTRTGYRTCYRTVTRNRAVITINEDNCADDCGGCSGTDIASPTCRGWRKVSYQLPYVCNTGFWWNKRTKTCYRTLYKHTPMNICCNGMAQVNPNSCQRCGKNRYGVATLSALSEDTTADETFPKIRGGANALVGQFPWQVRLSIRKADGTYICGGSIIADRWVLTAAHCISGSVNSQSFAFVGDHRVGSLDTSEVRHTFQQVIPHNRFNLGTSSVTNHDIALIKLQTTITFNQNVAPICLPERARDYRGRTVTISGWGRTNSGGIADVLQFTKAEVVRDIRCDFWGRRTNEICANGLGSSTACKGDSGGPMTIVENGRAYQIGVAWFVKRASCPTRKSFAYTDVGPYLDWIRSTTGLH